MEKIIRAEKDKGHSEKKKVKWMMKHVWKAYEILLYMSQKNPRIPGKGLLLPSLWLTLLNTQVMPLEFSTASVELDFKN